MSSAIVMPKVGLTMTEGKIVEWKKGVGQRVDKGEIVFVFETEKVSFDVDAAHSGFLVKIIVGEGETVPVGTEVAILADSPGGRRSRARVGEGGPPGRGTKRRRCCRPCRYRRVAGTWKDLTDSVNSMAGNLTAQVRNIAAVTTAVATGDLSRKITVDVRGEILELKNTINTMVDQLNAFAGEVTRVAREVGTEGKLGGPTATSRARWPASFTKSSWRLSRKTPP